MIYGDQLCIDRVQDSLVTEPESVTLRSGLHVIYLVRSYESKVRHGGRAGFCGGVPLYIYPSRKKLMKIARLSSRAAVVFTLLMSARSF